MAPLALSDEKNGIQMVSTSLDSGTTEATQTDDPLENLRIFQELVGIMSSPPILEGLRTPATGSMNPEYMVRRPKPPHKLSVLFQRTNPTNDGYYISAIRAEYKAYIGYQVSSLFINLTYLLQIFVAATITALSAYENQRVVITVLGAINTVLAGLVAYFKGMGLPNRLRKSRDQYQHVKEYIDYKERQFVWYTKLHNKKVPNKNPSLATLDPWTEAEQVRTLYEAARKDEQANYPDMYVNDNQRHELEKIHAKNREGPAAPGPAFHAPNSPAKIV